MGLAPSEKHIEDWIVGNFSSFNKQTSLNIQRIVGRQIPMPSGILDLLVMMPLSLTVVELKKGEIDEKSIAQVHRYIVDLVNLHYLIYDNIHDGNDLHAHSSSMTHGEYWRYPIHGILIGNSISDRSMNHCMDSHIETVIYDFEDGDYYFERDACTPEERSQDDYTIETIGAVRELMRHLKLRDHKQLTRDMFTWEERE